MKTTTFEWIMVAVMSIVLICTIIFAIDYNMDLKEAKAESETVNIVDAKVEEAINAADELMNTYFDFLMSSEYQEWVNAYEMSY